MDRSCTRIIAFLLGCLPCAAQPAPPKTVASPLYLTIVSHNEEPNQRQPDYLNLEFYTRNRQLLRQLALTIKEKGGMLNFQSDWNFLEAVGRFDAKLTSDTGGKNIVRWLVDDLGFEADPHAHETKYNYADVAYLFTQLGVKPSGNVGGFLYDPPDHPRGGWEKHENGVSGKVYPSFFWKADQIWGAGTMLHRGNDERRHGVWRPKDRYNFYAHDPARRLIYVGGNCYSWSGMPTRDIPGLLQTLAVIADGKAPRGYYTANIFVAQGQLTEELIRTIAADLDRLLPYATKGALVWSSLTETARRWKTAYGGQPFQMECGSLSGAPAKP